MSLSDDDIPRPSMVVVRSRLNFLETDVLELGETLDLRLQKSVTAAQVARRLERIAREYVIAFAIEHESSSAQQTATWCERLSRKPSLAAIAANPIDARLALMLNPDRDLASTPDFFQRRTREAARYWRSQPKQNKVYNRKKPENGALLIEVVEALVWAFGVPRPATNAKASNLVFQAAGKFIETLAKKLATKLAPEAEPMQAYMQAFHRRPDIAERAARYLLQFKPETMASLWRRNGG